MVTRHKHATVAGLHSWMAATTGSHVEAHDAAEDEEDLATTADTMNERIKKRVNRVVMSIWRG